MHTFKIMFHLPGFFPLGLVSQHGLYSGRNSCARLVIFFGGAVGVSSATTTLLAGGLVETTGEASLTRVGRDWETDIAVCGDDASGGGV